jgi:hypothetical protein
VWSLVGMPCEPLLLAVLGPFVGQWLAAVIVRRMVL